MKTTLNLSIFKFCIVGMMKIDAILREAVGDVLGVLLFWQVSSDLLGVLFLFYVLQSQILQKILLMTDKTT